MPRLAQCPYAAIHREPAAAAALGDPLEEVLVAVRHVLVDVVLVGDQTTAPGLAAREVLAMVVRIEREDRVVKRSRLAAAATYGPEQRAPATALLGVGALSRR